ncbi:MAG TPA: TIGR00341 family protein, partial [Hyphomonas atlantica]|nr:TIGR00341 family protein [Hyphomonas atlantica]
IDLQSRELMSRAEVRLDGLALAMAAGGAAALSLTRGQASALVGVMVAAALLPPGAALGLFVGTGHWTLAMRAGLLLALNVVALVLAALIVFRLRKIRPRAWIDQKNAQRAVWINAALSILLLTIA